MSKKKAIEIRQERYTTWRNDGYGGQTGSSDARTIVTFLDITKTFENDLYMHDTKDWINKTFASEKYEQIKSQIKQNELEIKKLRKENESLDKKFNTFLVPVHIKKDE